MRLREPPNHLLQLAAHASYARAQPQLNIAALGRLGRSRVSESERDSAPTGGNPVQPPVRFPLPVSVLERLRSRREAQRAEREATKSSGGTPAAVRSLDKILTSLAPGDDLPAIAASYVDDMNALQTEVEEQYDAFLLDPGMGPMVYLAADGRVIIDNRSWDGEGLVVETSLDGAVRALVVGAKKTGIAELLDLVPPLVDASPCPSCAGTRFMTQPRVVCLVCDGRGEIDDRLRRRAQELGLA